MPSTTAPFRVEGRGVFAPKTGAVTLWSTFWPNRSKEMAQIIMTLLVRLGLVWDLLELLTCVWSSSSSLIIGSRS